MPSLDFRDKPRIQMPQLMERGTTPGLTVGIVENDDGEVGVAVRLGFDVWALDESSARSMRDALTAALDDFARGVITTPMVMALPKKRRLDA